MTTDNRRVTPPPGDHTIDAIERILLGGIGLTARALAEVPAASDLTLPQWRVLMVVADSDGVRIGELAARLGGSVPSASRLVRRLERHGLVTAERDDADRRATDVRLTHPGRALRGAVLTRRRELIEGALADARLHVPDRGAALLERIADALAVFS